MIVNEFADLTDEEFEFYMTGAKPTDERLDLDSKYYDFTEMKEIDNQYV